MRDFLKSRLQNSPGGVILESLDLKIHASSGNRTVKRHDSRIISSALYFAGLRDCIGVIHAARLLACFQIPIKSAFFMPLKALKKQNKITVLQVGDEQCLLA